MIRLRGSVLAQVAMLSLLLGSFVNAQEKLEVTPTHPILWTDPGDIKSRNLFWGSGWEDGQPHPPSKFLEEDMHGTNPKFDVRDSSGEKWRVKMGPEVHPEVAASRLLWAVGYCTNDNYFLATLPVSDMPQHLRRGQKLAGTSGTVPNVRLQRRPKGLKKVGNWNWVKNPLVGTREFNGLRVMMALLRNWDMDDDNSAILQDEKYENRTVYQVSDLGATLGKRGRGYHFKTSVGNLEAFQRGKLMANIRPDSVDLDFPKMPPFGFFLDRSFYRNQKQIQSIGKNIPRSDAKWIGNLLDQLSADQIRDAFRAAGYSKEWIEGYTRIILARIRELTQL